MLENTPNARVPTQLLSPDDEQNTDTDKEDKEMDNVDEFSGVGGVAGYTLPLGTNPDKHGRKKNKK